jgi:hypothetical protein
MKEQNDFTNVISNRCFRKEKNDFANVNNKT